MCGIVGFDGLLDDYHVLQLIDVISRARERGDDAVGWAVYRLGSDDVEVHRSWEWDPILFRREMDKFRGAPIILIANVRAEPTTEWVPERTPETARWLHPFVNEEWAVVHNGTIANDKELEAQGYYRCADSPIDSAVLPALFSEDWDNGLREIVGSFAILAIDRRQGRLAYATNYKPLYASRVGEAIYVTSYPQWVQAADAALPIAQYTYGQIHDWRFVQQRGTLYPYQAELHLVVIASGGLDSTVAAWKMRQDYPAALMTLLHFRYGCRAQAQEVAAVWKLAEHLDAVVEEIDVEPLFRVIADTAVLLDKSKPTARGDAGAEFAYEWVPARNLIFLSLATAYAENSGQKSIIVTGTNLEESGAYPDNEPEFIRRFNHLLPYAVGANARVSVEDPVGHLMKKGIVKLGLDIGAPLDATWSCYYGEKLHCGTCGPCHMRRLAFKMNGEEDPIAYEER